MRFGVFTNPALSVVVIIFNMTREAKRTLYSLSAEFQRGIEASDYEVIVVENGSTEPLTGEFVKSFGPNFRYFFFRTSSKSPAAAINFGAGKARGKFVGLMLDGARIVSPGMLKYALLGTKLCSNPIIATLAWHLGPDVQYRSMNNGYTREVEDDLLAKAKWTEDGYRLFGISSLAGSSKDGFFLPIAESNCFFLSKETFGRLGGYDERFGLPGGGLVNLDIYKRACEMPGARLFFILGEGTFHQLHGGVSTNVSAAENSRLWQEFDKEYYEIRGCHYELPRSNPEYIGHVPPELLRFVKCSTDSAQSLLSTAFEGEPRQT